MLSSAQGVLIRAVQKFGAIGLGERLSISQMTLQALITGITPISDGILLSTLDLLIEQGLPNPPASQSPQHSKRN